ncbi:hypothetical protein JCM8097_007409 [Rhodosporidiobolus ruineniae]
MAPTIDVFVTSILSNPAIRGRHERVKRAMTAARVAYAEHDVASDEQAKSLWKRKNGGKNELPFLLVDGECPGSIEDLDEAVEFGELRQFLRLDTPSEPPPPAAPAPTSATSAPLSASSSSNGAAPPSSSSSSDRKPTLDDFADLNLSPDELAELQREISQGETFSSGLGGLSSHDPSRSGFDFSTATRRFEPVFAPTAPLKIEKINFTRPLPDRPLASEVAKDELEGIDQAELDDAELERLVKELEGEENERRRLRDAQNGGGVEPPPLPEKEGEGGEGDVKSPRLPKKDFPLSPDVAYAAKEEGKDPAVAEATSVAGAGGAALSAPVAEIDRLHLSSADVHDLAADLPYTAPGAQLSVAPSTPRQPSSASFPSPSPSSSSSSSSLAAVPPSPAAPVRKTSKKDAAQLKSELFKAVEASEDADPERLKAVGGSLRVSEMPDFAAGGDDGEGKAEKKVEQEKEEKDEERTEELPDDLVDRVAEAIRGGDL